MCEFLQEWLPIVRWYILIHTILKTSISAKILKIIMIKFNCQDCTSYACLHTCLNEVPCGQFLPRLLPEYFPANLNNKEIKSHVPFIKYNLYDSNPVKILQGLHYPLHGSARAMSIIRIHKKLQIWLVKYIHDQWCSWGLYILVGGGGIIFKKRWED